MICNFCHDFENPMHRNDADTAWITDARKWWAPGADQEVLRWKRNIGDFELEHDIED